jgi:hypothetical protein
MNLGGIICATALIVILFYVSSFNFQLNHQFQQQHTKPHQSNFSPKCDIPVVVLARNNPTFLKQIVSQLHSCFNATVIIIDNGSTLPEMNKLLNSWSSEKGISILRLNQNFGPHVLFQRNGPGADLFSKLPRFFALTDSDIRLNDQLPSNFLCVLKHVTSLLSVPKAGFALDLSDSDRMWKVDWYDSLSIAGWEDKFWHTKISQLAFWPEIYQYSFIASIDTTFAVYDKDQLKFDEKLSHPWLTFNAIRIAGPFTSKHLPWYPDVFSILPQIEIESMYKNSQGTFSGGIFGKHFNNFTNLIQDSVAGRPKQNYFKQLPLLDFSCSSSRNVYLIPDSDTLMRPS